MKNIICICSSPCIDKYLYVDTLKAGTEKYIDCSKSFIGGKAVNTAFAITAFGGKAKILMPLNDNSLFENEFNKSGIDFSFSKTNTAVRENVTIIEKNRIETRLSQKPHVLSNEEISAFLKLTDAEDGIFVLSGSIEKNLKSALVQALSKKSEIVLDSKDLSQDDVKALSPFLIKPNFYEAQSFTKTRICDKKSLLEALFIYKSLGVKNVLLSLGENGMVLFDSDNKLFYAQAIPLCPLSTVGAGDSAVAGFLTAYTQGKKSKDALIYALAFSAAACMTTKNFPEGKEEIVKLIDKVKITEEIY